LSKMYAGQGKQQDYGARMSVIVIKLHQYQLFVIHFVKSK
jgi:hypothetical protein